MMQKRGKLFKLDFWNSVIILTYLLFGLFLIYPLFALFISSFKIEGVPTEDFAHFVARLKEEGVESLSFSHYIQFFLAKLNMLSWDNYIKFFTKKYYYSSLLNSFAITISVTILSMLVGAPLAYVMASIKIKGKRILEVLIIISLLSPPFIGAYSWILLLGRSGVVTQFFEQYGVKLPSIYGFAGILLVFTLKLFPFIYLYVSGALKKIDVSLSEAAESLGCSGIKKVFTIIFPLILPTMLAGGLLVFMNALADFGTPMLIGEGFRVMPVLIYSEFISEVGGEANFAAALSMIVVVLTTGIFLLQKYIVNKKSFTMSSLRPMEAKKIKGSKNIISHLFVYLVVGIAIIPQITVIYTSFLKTKGAMFVEGFSLDSYRMVFSRLSTEIINTYMYGLIAIVIIVIIGMFVAYVSVRRKSKLTNMLDTIIMIPYIIPGSVLGITLLLAFNEYPLLLSGTMIIMIIAFVIRRLPYTLRSSAAILYQISPSMEEASISLGYSQAQTFFKVTAKMMMSGVIAGAILSWITIITELSSSIILFTGSTKTMSVSVYNEVIRASYGTAAALSTLLTLTTIISLLIFFKLTGNKEITM